MLFFSRTRRNESGALVTGVQTCARPIYYLVFGAMTSHAMVARSKNVNGRIPALAALADGIGDAQVRHRGTIGGSIANHDPAADYPAACLRLGATLVTDAPEIVADAFFTGLFETALGEHAIISAVLLRAPQRTDYKKFAKPATHPIGRESCR